MEGDFTTLRELSSAGVMTDILTLIGSGGGGGGTITSATAPLAINSGVLSIDLASYATTAAVNTLLANFVLASAYNTAMPTKIDTLTAGSNITSE